MESRFIPALLGLFLFPVLAAAVSGREGDCTGLLKQVLYSNILGQGSGGVIAEVKMAGGKRFAAKFHFSAAAGQSLPTPATPGVRVQKLLAEQGLAPQFLGASTDPVVLRTLLKQLPAATRKKIQLFGGVGWVTLHEVTRGVALHYDHPIPPAEVARIRALVNGNRARIRAQLEQAESIFREAGVAPLDVQAMLLEAPDGVRLQFFDFDAVRVASNPSGELEDVRDDLARFGL